MFRIEPRHPEVFRLTALTPRVVKAIGLVIIGLGVYLLGYGVGVPGISVMDEDGRMAEPSHVLIPGVGMTLLGYGFIFGRKGLIVDRARGEVMRWTGAPMPLWKQRYRLDLYRTISISGERHENSERSLNEFPVRFEGEGGYRLLAISPPDPEEAFQAARELGAFLGWPVKGLPEDEEKEDGKRQETPFESYLR